MDYYNLSRNWFNWCFENPERINSNHTALYFFCIEHCNRLGWKQKFGLPTTMAKEAIGIRSYNTYIKTLNDLIDFGFIKLIEKSKNQYSSNIIALSNFNKAHDKAHDKALDKALIKHYTKQSESTIQSNDSIDKQIYNNTNIQETIIPKGFENCIDLWLKFKSEKGQTYKKTGFQTMVKKLVEMANNNPETALKIVNQSIMNNYAGLFNLKNETKINNGAGTACPAPTNGLKYANG